VSSPSLHRRWMSPEKIGQFSCRRKDTRLRRIAQLTGYSEYSGSWI
jgi:hypothetical protein